MVKRQKLKHVIKEEREIIMYEKTLPPSVFKLQNNFPPCNPNLNIFNHTAQRIELHFNYQISFRE